MTETCVIDCLRHERDEAWAELARLRDELADCEAKADIATQVAGVAHDIATPVGIALTAASLLREHARRIQAAFDIGQIRKQDLKAFLFLADESADIMLANISRAASLLQAFKQVAVDQLAPARRRYLLAAYLDEVLRSLAPQLRKKAIGTSLDCPATIAMEGPAGALAQVITNLLTNALVHAFESRSGGAIAIMVTEPDENSVEVQISDDGRGIPADLVPMIFEPFFTTRRGHGGSGLGLYMVRRLVERDLGGRVVVTSREGESTTFTLHLPRLAPR